MVPSLISLSSQTHIPFQLFYNRCDKSELHVFGPFLFSGKRTRGHDFTLVEGQSRFDARKYSFSHRTLNSEWNKVSADCVHSNSTNMFKNRIYNYLDSNNGLSISQRLPCAQLLLGWQSD